MDKSIYILFLINLFSGMGYSILAPLFPTISIKRGISETLLGFIISLYALCNLILSLTSPILFQKYGRKNCFYLCTFLEASSSLLYGFLIFIDNYWTLLFTVLFLRIVHGGGTGITGTLIYSLPATICKNEHDAQTALGYMEISWSLGLSIGPVIASIFYSIGGYTLPFIFLGSVMFIGFFLVKQLDLSFENENKETKEDTLTSVDVPSIHSLFVNKYMMLVLFGVLLNVYMNTFFSPSLLIHITTKYGISVSYASLFFGVITISYFIFLQFLNPFIDRFGLYGSILIGCVFMFVGALFVYPIIIFPQTYLCTILGLGLIGVATVPMNIPSLRLMEIYLTNELKIDSLISNDYASVVYNVGVNLGDFLGPILGGFFSDHFGFQFSTIISSFFNVIYLVIFYNKFYKYILQENKLFKQTVTISDNIIENKEQKLVECEIIK